MIEALTKDPTAAQAALRAMGMVQLVELHQTRHLLTPTQRMQLAELNTKLGDMVPKQAPVQGQGGAVTINFIRSNERAVTIEAAGVAVAE